MSDEGYARIMAAAYLRRAAFQGLAGERLRRYAAEVAPEIGVLYGPALKRATRGKKGLIRRFVREVQEQAPKDGPRRVTRTGPMSKSVEAGIAAIVRENPEAVARIRRLTGAIMP